MPRPAEVALMSHVDGREPAGPASRLDAKTIALVQVAALVAVGASPAAYRSVIGTAAELGFGDDEVIRTLLAVAPIVGMPRLVAASVSVASALGYDVEAALESPRPLEELEAAVAPEPLPSRRVP
jgi:alkylhydroperoxidase/carboxymuconolactone decarboxylase family protein YurZ